VVAIAFAVAAGFQPAFSEISPQRLSVNYVEDTTRHKTFWSADAGGFFGSAPLPPSLRAAAKFSNKPERPFPFSFGLSYLAPAGPPRFESPSALASVSKEADGTRRIVLTLYGSPQAGQMIIAVPKSSGLKTIEIDGKRFDVPKVWAQLPGPYDFIGCFSRDCATKTITLDVSAQGLLSLLVGELRYGLPPDGQKLIAARPKTAVASQNGDTTVLINSVTVPAG
jgi:hypothetical protein